MTVVNLKAGHVTGAQIDAYLRKKVDAGIGDLHWVGLHLSECKTCLEHTLQVQRAQLGFVEMARGSASRHPDCPDEETVRILAAGFLNESGPQLIHHVVHCDFCGPLLQQWREAFSDNVSPEETEFLASLETSSQQWQQSFVERHIPAPVTPRPSKLKRLLSYLKAVHAPPFRRWAIISASTISILALIFIEQPVITDKLQKKKAVALALSAVSEQPTIEMRIPGARYARHEIELGPIGTKNPDLEEAQSIVGRKKRESGRLDRSWLPIEGLTLLLEGTPDATSRASTAFEQALAEGVDDPSVQIELAASYYEAEHADVAKAIELLETVLKRPNLTAEDHEAALYNLALAYESIQDWQAAVARWDEYLKVDSSSEWAKEARKRLENDRHKIPTPQARDPNPRTFLLSPGLQALDEEYQEIALQSWLPQAVLQPGSEAAQATHRIADLLAGAPHYDPFLTELLAASSPRQVKAFSDLSDAITANKAGEYEAAEQNAHRAAVLFQQQHNRAGDLRSRFEEVFAAQQAVSGQDCLPRARTLSAELRSTNFKWLQAGSALELATCLNLAGELASAELELGRGKAIGERAAFPVLGLRILGVGAGIHRLQNRRVEAWQEAVDGLRRFGERAYPWERLYQLYSVMEQCAEQEHLLHLQRTFLLQAIALQELNAQGSNENLVLKGALYGRLSTVQLALKEEGAAQEASARSDMLLGRVPDKPSVNVYVAYAKVGLAEAQLRLGNPRMALATLEPARERVAGISDQFISLDFYRVLGGSYRSLGRYDDAAGAYQTGIVLAEQALASMSVEKNRAKWIAGVDPVYRGLTLVLLEQGKDADAFRLWEWYGSRTLGSKSNSKAISWPYLEEKISSIVPPINSGTRLVYAVFEERLQIWTMNGQSVKGSGIKIKESELLSEVNDFASQCANDPRRLNSTLAEHEVRASSAALWALLLQSVMSELKPSQVVVVDLDPRIANLPLAALLSPNGRYFGQDYMLINSSGGYRRPLPLNKETRLSQEPVLLALGSVRELPGQDAFKETILAHFKHISIKSARRAPWTEVERGLRDSQIFVFIGHGIKEGPSTYLLYGKSQIRALDFPPNLVGHLQLVILEACSSGAEGEQSLQETTSLVHAFRVAGVPSVIATRWNVDSQTTARLLSTVVQDLGLGEPIPKALHHARNEILRLQPHPYFWAGIDAFGRAQ